MLFFILIYQNLQTLQDLENMRKEQIEEMDNTRSNLDELQNKLTEVRVIPTFNILRHMSKTKNRAILLKHIFQPLYCENVSFVHFCITGNSFLIIAFHLVNFANVYILYFQIYIIWMQNIKKEILENIRDL